jgi:chromosome segregation ATPase
MEGNQFAAWIAGFSGLLALAIQGANIFKNRKKERRAVDEALDRNPIVRQQLELGNVAEAVKQLNIIIDTQARALDHETTRREAAERREDAMEEELHATEAKVDEQADQLREQQRTINRQGSRIKALEAEVDQLYKQAGLGSIGPNESEENVP